MAVGVGEIGAPRCGWGTMILGVLSPEVAICRDVGVCPREDPGR